MKVVVQLFAGAREAAGQQHIEVEQPATGTIGQLRLALIDACPDLRPLMAHSMFAIDATYVADEMTVSEDDDIACIPPVSGG